MVSAVLLLETQIALVQPTVIVVLGLGSFAVELERVPWNTTWTVGHALDGGLQCWNCRTIVWPEGKSCL